MRHPHDEPRRARPRPSVLERAADLEEQAEDAEERGNPGRAASLRWAAAAARTAFGTRLAVGA